MMVMDFGDKDRKGRVAFSTLGPFGGLDYLHSVGVAHLDLKLENLAIYHGGQLKICNFGKACSPESAS
ncbi:protein kinase [Entomophthora muscae]|uniref:Protein kinase n=1 Tax=Entomophthora muscae TaxID=34485 RepID=A0ACC2S135_9FUNG|nr:protein kinase [Entomophthora muscae]